jgi:hypothetical protein
MDMTDYFTWLVLSSDAIALIVALGWYLSGDIRKTCYRRSLSRDPRVFDPHVLVNGRWVPKEVPHLCCLPFSEQREWLKLHGERVGQGTR